MSASEFAGWLENAIPAYAADKVTSGQWSAEDAPGLSRKEFNELLPLGPQTAENHLYVIVSREGDTVGGLWFAVQQKFGAPIAYVYDISIEARHRRKGYALATFLALEALVRNLGLCGIALHVFGHNDVARELYAKLGFQPTNISLYKPLGAATK